MNRDENLHRPESEGRNEIPVEMALADSTVFGGSSQKKVGAERQKLDASPLSETREEDPRESA